MEAVVLWGWVSAAVGELGIFGRERIIVCIAAD
jgi:hypothetical protein